MKSKRLILLLSAILFLAGCGETELMSPPQQDSEPQPTRTTIIEKAATAMISQDSDLVLLSEVDSTIVVEEKLATSDNPFHYQFYRDSGIAYLRRGTAKKLKAVQDELRAKGLRLKIWAAYRPFAVQVKMFEAVGGNPEWVSDPYRDSGKKTHVRAVAVDCTLVDQQGHELAMPTPYLDFENGAERMKHSYRDLPPEILANRKLLKDVMIAHGMEPYEGEWWHYQDEDWAKYPVIGMDEFPEVHRRLLVDELLRK